MQELIGYYIPMEEYYMRESVHKVKYSFSRSIVVVLFKNSSVNICVFHTLNLIFIEHNVLSGHIK